MECRNKNIVIAGGASGLGLALTKRLLEKENKVFVLDVNESHLDKCQEECAAFKNSLTTIQIDVSELSSVQPVIEEIESKHRIDCLISSVGAALISPFEAISPEQWERVVKINLTGNFNLLHSVLPHLLKRRAGTIVVISSNSGMMPSPYCCGYSATKFGLYGMCDSLRYEVADRGVKLMTVFPGEFKSNLGETSVKMGTMPFEAKNAGMPAEYVADKVIEGLENNLSTVVVVGEEELEVVKSDFPYLVEPSNKATELFTGYARQRAKRFGF